ncbi:MAG: lysophospholipase [Agathobacter sp.]|nr:lysophospholipase [Agathobacter sp.]
MSKKTEFEFLSGDGKTKIHAVKWEPESGDIKAVLQLCHGMVEYIERYEALAEYLNAKGILVAGHDHLGHGGSVTSQDEWGFFKEGSPSDTVVEDMHTMRMKVRELYPNVPYFIMGHSMGSYMLRKYLVLHGEGLDGAIICGTGFIPASSTKAAKKIVSVMAKFKGWHYRSKMVEKLTFGKSYKGFDMDGSVPENSWLTKDVNIVNTYYNEPRCTFRFTLNGYYGLFEAVEFACDKENAAKLRKDLPLFVISGDKDPVGDLGVGVKKVYDMYQDAGVEDITYKLYKDDRHEICNELDKQTVFQDIFAWIIARV